MIQYFLEAVYKGFKSAIGCDTQCFTFGFSLFMIFLSFCLWCVAYLISRRLFKHQSAEFCIRAITFVHGLCTTLTSTNLCFFAKGKCLINEPTLPSSDPERLLMATNLGYFLLDLIWSVNNQTETNLMLVHHVYAIAALYYVLRRAVGGGQFACGMAAMECTNPLLQTRWFLRSFGLHKTALFDTVELVFMALFIFIRLILGSAAMLIAFTDHRIDWIFAVNLSIIYGLSWMFAYNMCLYVQTKYFNKSTAAQRTESNYEVAI